MKEGGCIRFVAQELQNIHPPPPLPQKCLLSKNGERWGGRYIHNMSMSTQQKRYKTASKAAATQAARSANSPLIAFLKRARLLPTTTTLVGARVSVIQEPRKGSLWKGVFAKCTPLLAVAL